MPPPEPTVTTPRGSEIAAAAFTAVGYALSARAILLLSVVFAFVLGAVAMAAPSTTRLWTLVVFCSLAVIPQVILEALRRRA